MAYYGTTDYKITHFPINIGFVILKKFPTPKSLDETIKFWLKNMPAHGAANWMVSKIILLNNYNIKNTSKEIVF